MSDQKFIAVAGCGHWGKNLVRNFAELGALATICDNNPDTASHMAAQYNVSASTYQEVLANDDIKAVILASPAPFHFDMARDALKAGKDVYVEKPITLKTDEAQILCDLATQNDRILMVGHLLQYHPAFITLKEMVLDGKLGNLQYIYSNRMSFGKVRREENVLWSFAPHDVSMILALAGGEAPIDVTANGSAQTHSTIEDFALIKMAFKNGLAAHVNVSWLNPFKEQKLVVIGDKGAVVFDDQQDWSQKVMHYPHVIDMSKDMPSLNKADAVPVAVTEGEPLKMECQHFIDCVENRAQPRTDGAEGLRVLDVLTRADKAMGN